MVQKWVKNDPLWVILGFTLFQVLKTVNVKATLFSKKFKKNVFFYGKFNYENVQKVVQKWVTTGIYSDLITCKNGKKVVSRWGVKNDPKKCTPVPLNLVLNWSFFGHFWRGQKWLIFINTCFNTCFRYFTRVLTRI